MDTRTQSPGRLASHWTRLESRLRTAADEGTPGGGAGAPCADGKPARKRPLSNDQVLAIAYDRLMRHLRSVAEGTDAVSAQPALPDGALTPESVAGHVRSFGMDVFGVWRARYAELAEDEADAAFGRLVEDAVDQGLREAWGVVESLKVFNEDLMAISNFMGQGQAQPKSKCGTQEPRGAAEEGV